MGHNGNGGFQLMQWKVCPGCGKKYPTGVKSPKDQCGYCERGKPRTNSRKGVGPSCTPEYKVWRAMLNRCYNEQFTHYHRYGGRGIQVCSRWKGSFENFLADMGPRPSGKHRIERKDNDGTYAPENCCWETQKNQCRNTSANKLVEINGTVKSLAEWAEIYGISYKLAHDRINKRGWDASRALSAPKMRTS